MKRKMELLEGRIIPRRIVTPASPSRIKKDLERYRTMALEMGAADAAIIPSKEILIDERVRTVLFPRCRSY